MKQFVLYARSPNPNPMEASLDFSYQLEHLTKYAVRFERGEVLAEFTEIAPNNTLENRPELQSAIALANEHEAILMVDHVHIISVMMKDLLHVLDEIEDRFYCCSDLEETDEPYK